MIPEVFYALATLNFAFLLSLCASNLPGLFAFTAWYWFFADKRTRRGFAFFALLIFSILDLGAILDLKLFNAAYPLIFLGFIVIPLNIWLAKTRWQKYTPILVLLILFSLSIYITPA